MIRILSFLLALLAATASLASSAHAQTSSAPRVRPTASAGISFALLGLDTYGIAADVHAGVDLDFGDHSNELTLGASWTPYTMTGARLDLFALDAGWRWRPAPETGFFVRVTLGLVIGREALDVHLGQRRIEDIQVSPGLSAEVAIGWTFFEYVDVQLGWREVLLASSSVESVGSFVVSVGARL